MTHFTGQLERKTDACREGVVTDVLDILGEIHGTFVGDELIVFL
jgi:hypothetical protein